MPDGKFARYYPNGQLAASGEFRDGVREGLWVYYEWYGAWDRERSGYYEADLKVARPPWSDGAVICTRQFTPEELARALEAFLATTRAAELTKE